MRITATLLGLLMLSGCSTLENGVGGFELLEKAGQVEDATLGNAMKSLPIYCKLPKTVRMTFRARANARPEAQGATIAITCPGDA